MDEFEWAVDLIRQHVVKVVTPDRSGTGFFVSVSKDNQLCGIATAAHVVIHAHEWEQPIRIFHLASGKVRLLRASDRAILVDERLDTSAIVFQRNELPLPPAPQSLTPEGHFLKIGYEVGWVGFPALSPDHLCFFTGRISTYLSEQNAYLVDGVAINGVSGGPAFTCNADGTLTIIGVVSAYVPNRATGEALPGLCMLSDVLQLQDVVKSFASLDEAKEKEQQLPPVPDLTHSDEEVGD